MMERRHRRAVIGSAAVVLASVFAHAEHAAGGAVPTVTLVEIAGIERPLGLAWRVDDEAMYVFSQPGQVVRVDGDDQTTVLDITELATSGGERGLLGLAFSADGTKAYVNYTDRDGHTNVVEFDVEPDGVFDQASMRVVLFVEQPEDNHNGGDLHFGPDGMMYVALGDGGPGRDPDRRAQDLGDLLGKLLRIDPSQPSGDLGYAIPADNPFVGVDGARPEIWAFGLRNPWRFSFDADNGDLWIADVGQAEVEEVDHAPADELGAGRGLNFGWSGFEGSRPFNDDVSVTDHTPPVFEYSHDNDRCSISGGVRPRGDGAGDLAGWYLFGDFCSGELMAIEVSGDGADAVVGSEMVVLAHVDGGVTAVSSGLDGTVYVFSYADSVYRVDVG